MVGYSGPEVQMNITESVGSHERSLISSLNERCLMNARFLKSKKETMLSGLFFEFLEFCWSKLIAMVFPVGFHLSPKFTPLVFCLSISF